MTTSRPLAPPYGPGTLSTGRCCFVCERLVPLEYVIPMFRNIVLPVGHTLGVCSEQSVCQDCWRRQQALTEPITARGLLEKDNLWANQVSRERCYELCRLTAERMGVPYWEGRDPHFGTREESVSCCIDNLHHCHTEARVVLAAERHIRHLLAGKRDHEERDEWPCCAVVKVG